MPRSDFRTGKAAKRWLYLTHRWIGIGSCLLFCIWFLSGLVMIYVPYPSLSARDRAAAGGAIDWQQVERTPSSAAIGLSAGALLVMRDGQPVWRMTASDGTLSILPARSHLRISPVDEAYALREAARFSGSAPVRAERVSRDQWTVAGGFDQHRPLWKVTVADAAGTSLYISTATGAVVQRTTRHARFWNWLGSVPHWIYPTALRQDNAIWRQVVMWVSGPSIAAAVTGFWIGILRTRLGRRRYKQGRMTPYHGWLLWHHVAGLTGGLFLIGWIFSGWLSVDPGRLFAGSDPGAAAARAYSGNPAPNAAELDRLRLLAPSATMVVFGDHGGIRSATIFDPAGVRSVVSLATGMPRPPADQRLAEKAGALVPEGYLVDAERLTAPDDYWYSAGQLPQLPILRLRFDDPARTWLYVDPDNGEVMARLDRRRRVYRWLFDLLHKWDLNALTLCRPVWQLLLWTGSLLGLATSISAIWLAVRRLRRQPAGARI